MYIDNATYKLLVGDSRARTVKSIAAVIKSKYPTAGDAFVDDMAASVVEYLEKCKTARNAKKLTAPCYWRRVKYWANDDPMSGGRLEAYVRTSALEIKQRGEDWLYTVAGAHAAYSAGPGQAYVCPPTWVDLGDGRVRVSQWFGYDI